MFRSLMETKLRNGEIVSAEVVHAPDAAWAERLEGLLAHKGDPWTWQNSELLRESTGVQSRFYVLHRDGRPFSTIMFVESAGVALLGHVWTEPADRGAGASGILMELLLRDFRAGGGRAIYLGTDPDSEPFHYYARRGFIPVEPGSGYMMLCKGPIGEFRDSWFVAAEAKVETLDWRHWPAAAPLCLADDPQQIRFAVTGTIGRVSSEAALLPLIRRQRRAQAEGHVPCALALCAPNGAVLGLASKAPHPMWPDRDVLDLFFHSRFWSRAPELLESLPLNTGRVSVAYTDVGAVCKSEVLAKAGYVRVATLPAWLRGGEDVVVWRRN